MVIVRLKILGSISYTLGKVRPSLVLTIVGIHGHVSPFQKVRDSEQVTLFN